MEEFKENMENRDSRLQTSSGEESEMRVGGAGFHAGQQEAPAGPEKERHSGTHGKGRAGKLFGPLRKPLAGTGRWLRKHFGIYMSPVFILMLLVSFGMWYTIKLSYPYTIEITVRVDIEGHEMVVPCVAEGEGTDLLLNRREGRTIHMRWSDLDVTPSVNPGYVKISPESLRHLISVGRPNIKIISIGAIPEVKL